MSRLINRYIVFLVLGCLIVACSSKKTVLDDAAEKLAKQKEERLIAVLDSLSKNRPEHFYTKISSKYSDSEYKVSFKTSIRMRADSALHALITFARIPIYNTMVTPDTLTIVDRRNNCFIQEDMGYLKNTFDVDFQHSNIEELILGMPVGWDSNEEYYQIRDPYNYIISSHNKRSLKKSGKDLSGDVYIRYYLNNEANQVKRIIIDSPTDTTTIDINYFQREFIEGFSIPLEADVRIETPRDTILIDMKYTKSTVNDPRILYLAIPDKYERCGDGE